MISLGNGKEVGCDLRYNPGGRDEMVELQMLKVGD